MGFWQKKEKVSKGTTKAKTNGLANVKKIIAIASGKGGVGKSTVTANMAMALSQMGNKVGVLDADVHGPSMPLMLPCDKPNSMVGELIVPPTANGIKVISSAMFSSQKAHIMRGPMAGNFVKQFLTQVDWGELDYLLIDYPPGTGDIQISLSQASPITGAVLVSTPQEVAIADVKKAHHMFQTLKVPILGVIETMSWFICDQCDKKHYVFQKDGAKAFADSHELPLLGQIPLDVNITSGADEGNPVVSSSLSVKGAFLSAAKALESVGLSHVPSNPEGLPSFYLKWQS